MYKAKTVAESVIRYCNVQRIAVNVFSLQIILYFIQAEFLVNRKHPCFAESVEAWDFGPVIPQIYQIYKGYGSGHIPFTDLNSSDAMTEDDQFLLKHIINNCSQYTLTELIEIVRKQNPWQNTYNAFTNEIIPNSEIESFFSKNKAKQQAAQPPRKIFESHSKDIRIGMSFFRKDLICLKRNIF